MNIPPIKITDSGSFGSITIDAYKEMSQDLLNYIKYSISNEFMGSVANGTTIRAIQTFIDGKLLSLVHNGQIEQDLSGIWFIKDYRGLWV